MANPVSEARPTLFSDWGDGAADFATDFLQPPAPLESSGWQFNNFPASEYVNWQEYITQRWIKNLDVRTPRIPIMKWFVGDQSGAHFATLPLAIASGSVVNGDWIFFSPSATNVLLSASITINKSVKIFFEPYTRFVKSNVAATRALILAAADIEIYGAQFSNGWSAGGDAAIALTAAALRCRIIGCNFSNSITEFVNDSAVPAGELPVLSQNLVEY